jgi:hypothetical protein
LDAEATKRGLIIGCLCESSLTSTLLEHNCSIAIFATQSRRGADQQSEDNRPVIIGQFDQAGFRNQAAELDKLPGSLATIHDPCSLVITRDLRLPPV